MINHWFILEKERTCYLNNKFKFITIYYVVPFCSKSLKQTDIEFTTISMLRITWSSLNELRTRSRPLRFCQAIKNQDKNSN